MLCHVGWQDESAIQPPVRSSAVAGYISVGMMNGSKVLVSTLRAILSRL